MAIRKARRTRTTVYDYIVVGAGSAGAAVAARLSENPAVTVLLVEAGGSDRKIETRAPAAFSAQFHSEGDWDYYTEPEPAAAGRRIYLPRGKVVGGCSTMNAMLWVRGSNHDFDGWNIPGWTWDDVEPIYRRMENHFLRDGEHSRLGPMKINRIDSPDPVALAFVEAAAAAGIERTDDLSGPRLDGVALAPTTTADGRRWNTARGYLDTAVKRPNFELLTRVHVNRVLVERGRTVGVEVSDGRTTWTLGVRQEVVLSAGAYNTPQLLQLSGIGDAEYLSSLGIRSVVDNPEVGAGLREHPFTFVNYELNEPWVGLADAQKPAELAAWLLRGKGKLASNVAEALAHIRTRSGLDAPDMQLVHAPVYFWNNGEGTHPRPAMTIAQSYWQPRSAGHVRIKSRDPRDAPEILMNMLSDRNDVEALMRGIEITREIARTAPFDRMLGIEINPGPNVRTPEQLERWIRETCLHTYHPACTARMGAVLDEELRVLGVEGLRVADTSAMPEITRGNTNAPAIMIGERCADFITGKQQAKVTRTATSRSATSARTTPTSQETTVLEGLMQDFPLTLKHVLDRMRDVNSSAEVVTLRAPGQCTRVTFGEVADRTDRLAGALQAHGIAAGDRVATFAWNSQEHVELYLAIPNIGAVLHTLNLRLFPEQLSYIINHAQDRIVFVDDSLVPLLEKVADSLTSVELFVVIGDGDIGSLSPAVRYEDFLTSGTPVQQYPEIDERAAAALCYTSGTTGNPRGVLYSHRSTVLHSMATGMVDSLRVSGDDRILPVVPQFHANAWGLVFAAGLFGSTLVMPGRFLQAPHIVDLIESEKVTFAGAVPTIWMDVLRYLDEHPEADISSLVKVACGGAAVPRSLMEAFEERHGIEITHAWGMTETSPLGSVAHAPAGVIGEERWEFKTSQGKLSPLVEARITDDAGVELPRDGIAIGEIEVRGPWIAGGYYLDEASSEERFHDGWLRTGDVGTLDSRGYLTITDRSKDIIKSGGEWISSVELENTLMGHPQVREAAVIAIPDERYTERPLACVVLDGPVEPSELREFLAGRVAKWWIPESFAVIDEVPKTSVGKFDKKVLREQFAKEQLNVQVVA